MACEHGVEYGSMSWDDGCCAINSEDTCRVDLRT